MSLATRLSAFFLAALGGVLVGFCATLFLAARVYLIGELDERLQRALDTLEASVDIEPGGLEWEPADRRMTLGVDRGETAVRWLVRDRQGAHVDRSNNSRDDPFPSKWSPPAWPANPADGTVFGDEPGWRLAARRLQLDELLRQGRGHPNDTPGYEVQYSELILIAGLKPAPSQATLRSLGLALVTLSTVIWIAAAAAGRGLCRRALAPVNRMAKAAAGMNAPHLGRLPVPGTGDELDGLGRAFNELLDRLDDSFTRLEEAYDRQRRFAGEASHQLRTPLAALLAQAQVALRRDRSPDEYRRVLEKIQAEGGRLRQVVESLLLLAQPEGMPVPKELMDLGAWAHDQQRRWSAHPRSADLKAEAAFGPLLVRAHAPLLGQVVDNLLENALKYSKPGAPVLIRTRRDGAFVALDVEDRGQGLASNDLARVFEPFFRAEEARSDGQAGVGLGLAVAQRLAATFGGTIEASSEPGVGSLFTLRLPAVD
jgi:signal transduction histidine kinase